MAARSRSGLSLLALLLLLPLWHVMLGVVMLIQDWVSGNDMSGAPIGFVAWVLFGWIGYVFVGGVPKDMVWQAVVALFLSLLILWPLLKGRQ